MSLFCQFLGDLELSELHLHRRLYTWSNEQTDPTLSRIDRAFVCLQWNNLFLHYRLRASASVYLDHSPLLLHTNVSAPVIHRFRFESIWVRFPGFMEAVGARWWCTLQNADSCRILDFKLRNTAKELKRWT
jgi:hypothetical protein